VRETARAEFAAPLISMSQVPLAFAPVIEGALIALLNAAASDTL